MSVHHFERNDIVYALTPERTAEGYTVSWQCPKCGKTGRYELQDQTEPAALGRTQARLYSAHHVPAHVVGNSEAFGS